MLRNDASSGVAAALTNAVFLDLGIIHQKNQDLVVDRAEVERNINVILYCLKIKANKWRVC